MQFSFHVWGFRTRSDHYGEENERNGIRKVLGVSETQITMLLSKNIALLICVSFVVASPATYWLLYGWLQNFAYRVTINPLLFLAGGFIALSIAFGDHQLPYVRSARANPVRALRYE